MFKLLCVGKESGWDYVSHQTWYKVWFSCAIASEKFAVVMTEGDYKMFVEGFWYEFDWQIYAPSDGEESA
jgi:hypothetical protein